MKIAIVHDWLTVMRGAEKVLEVFCELFPTADLHTILYIPGKLSPVIEKMNIKTSFIQHLPFAKRIYRHYLPIMPTAVEKFDMSGYDLVISSSYCVAKGVKKTSDSLHICYCHTPVRYIWDMYEEYFGERSTGVLEKSVMGLLAGYLRRWDVRSSESVNFFIANSNNVKKRIARHYSRDAEIIYPPVNTDFFTPEGGTGEDFYLVAGGLSPYKRIDLAIDVFNLLGYNLKIIGTGQDEEILKRRARPNIEFLGWRDDEELRDYYRRCRALIFPGEEDFGIVPLEAQACGRPVIAFGGGGALESVQEGISGTFFERQTQDSLTNAIMRFENMQFDSVKIREHAESFNREKFKNGINNFIRGRVKLI